MNSALDTGLSPAGSAAAAGPAKGLFFVRRVTAMRDFELFFVSSVSTILLVRAILAATGWPQLGGGKIHFAHLLWGGVGMLLAFILFMAMQGRLWDFLATLSAGIGFGLFLDELGKFITSDNDYFFQPAVAIMYVLFVVLFFVFRWLGRMDKMSPETALVNSFDFAKEAVMRSMDKGERDEALYVLGRADQSDPMVQALTAVLRGVQPPAAGANAAQRAWSRAHAWYQRLIARRWFRRFVIGWFVATSVLSMAAAVATLFVLDAPPAQRAWDRAHTWYQRLIASRSFRRFVIGWFVATSVLSMAAAVATLFVLDAPPAQLDLMNAGWLVANALTGALVVVGLVRWRASKLSAFRWFERGALVAILVGQFFAFYHDQVTAIVGLLWLLVQLAVIRSMVSAELAGTASRLHVATSGGDDGPHQV
jgi:hypothetical protein